MTMSSEDQHPIEITPAEARQGAVMRWPLRVLVVSTIAAAIGLAVFALPHF